MRYAETGYNLEVDLTRGNIERVETDPRLTELHLGGQGTNAKILWDRVPPEVEPFSPDNLLIFSAGLLISTPVPGANRSSVDTFSPQTDRYSHSLFGGFFGPELKHAGYDKVIFKGKSPDLVYLWINNDQVELRDASHLAGKGALETAEIIKSELKEPKAQVAAIGLAGENRVYMATIEHSNSSASRGVGVIMGDKKLKAIAVRGTKDINIAQPAELFTKCNQMYRDIYDNPNCGDFLAHEDDEEFHVNNFAWGNARERQKGFWNKEIEEKWKEITESVRLRWTGCYNCPKDCHQAIRYPGRQVYFQKCYSKLTYAMAAYKELDFNYDILGVTQEYGLDGFSTPQVLAFGVELYDAGILTDEDLPGFPKDTGERFFYLVDKIVRREGVGDNLANGVYWAARQIGKGAEEYDHNTMKKFEQVPLKLKMINYPYFLMYATGEKMNITQIEGSFPQIPIADLKAREEFVKNWEAAPERFKKWYLEWEPRSHPSIEASVNIADWNEAMHYIDDAVGTCAFLSSFRGQFGGRPPYHIYNLPEFISLASGLELDSDGLWEISRRNRNLVRALNVRRGLRRADEKPPADHWQVREPEMETKLLDAYYEFKGWNNDGIPTKETLDKLGLDYVSQDFIERGILTEGEKEPRRKQTRIKAKGVLTVNAPKTRVIKEIKVDLDKCIGCHACEVACSAFHAIPRYSSVNPSRSRIRVVRDELNDVYVPLRAGEYTPAECSGRHTYTINGKEYTECSFCGASCPARDYFKEPDSGLPLKCDMCETEPPLEEPMCVQVCRVDALTYVEREEEIEEEPEALDDMEISLESLAKKYGLSKIMESVARMSVSKKG